MNSNHLISVILKKPDPFGIRRKSVKIIKQAKLASLNYQVFDRFTHKLAKAINQKNLLDQSQFGKINNTTQKVFIINSVNFCFWAKKNQPKWTIKSQKGLFLDGWTALIDCFNRALINNTPILDPQFLSKLTLTQTKSLFKSSNHTSIPLLNKRHHILKETGKALTKHCQGSIDYLIKQADHDAIKLIKLILKYFKNWQDPFLKRAQICAYDLSMLKNLKLTNLNQLTIFADYKIPQLLRHHQLINYHPQLAKKIDQLKLIPKNSQAELEIRASTIIAGEILSILLKKPPHLIDNALWVLTQSKTNQQPYHRTLTTNY